MNTISQPMHVIIIKWFNTKNETKLKCEQKQIRPQNIVLGHLQNLFFFSQFCRIFFTKNTHLKEENIKKFLGKYPIVIATLARIVIPLSRGSEYVLFIPKPVWSTIMNCDPRLHSFGHVWVISCNYSGGIIIPPHQGFKGQSYLLCWLKGP